MISKNESYYSNIRFELVGLITKKEDIKVTRLAVDY